MIGSLRGRLTHKQAPTIIVECSGVGYEIDTPMSTFLELPDLGAELYLHTHLLVREDAQILYGFSTEDERLLFRTLLKVSGVGAKMALAVLSAMSVDDFQRCVEYEDTTTLIKIPGVGKKTAERLIIEMRDRVARAPASPGAARLPMAANARSEAVDALIALGYKPREVNKLIAAISLHGVTALHSADVGF